MAPPTNDNNDQQGLRRSTRSNLGKPGPSLINGYLTGDAAARPPLRPKRRVGESAAVNDEDDDGDEVASSTPSEPRKKSIVLDCIHVKLLSDMQRPSSPMGQTNAGGVDADAMDLDMYLNLDPQDDEHMADAEPSPKAPPKPAKVIDLDIDMGGLGDEFAEVM
ncbi:hypothetical protein ACHAO7_006415 [Fusarium culmorum]